MHERIRASALAAQGAGRGRRVALLMVESAPMLELAFAAAKLGTVIVPLNLRWEGPEIACALDVASGDG